MLVTEEIFQAFLKCETKSHLLSSGAVGAQREFVDWQCRQAEEYKRKCLAQLRAKYQEDEHLICTGVPNDLKNAKFYLAIDCLLQANGLQSHIHALERLASSDQTKRNSYIPVRFIPREKITSHDKLLLAFDALVLSAVSGGKLTLGKIIHGNELRVAKLKLPDLMETAKAVVGKISAQQTNASPPPPPLILNKHCAECEFKTRCRQLAVEKDELSLLSGLSEKERKKQHSKGIFTVTQLSYTYRPRRRPKRLAAKLDNYSHALRALAIRERKIHIAGSPKLNITGTPVYLDVEGVPDRDFYYLIGLRIKSGDSYVQHSFWANDESEEKEIWASFLQALAQIENPQLVHYGNYETTFMKQMKGRYGNPVENAVVLDQLIKESVNVLSAIYSQIYFPTYSNSLKEIALYLGFQWSENEASGLISLIWRAEWERTKDADLKRKLITYNQEDCLALRLLKDRLSEIVGSANTLSEIDFVDQPKRQSTKSGEQVHDHFETILKFARSDYDRKKIHFQQHENEAEGVNDKKRRNSKKGYQGQRRKRPKAQKTIQVASAKTCPKHNRRLVATDRTSKRLIIDLVLRKNGIKKTITEYIGLQGYCTKCYRHYIPPEIGNYGGANQLYGHGFQAWIVYQRVALKMTYGAIAEAMSEQFNETEPGETIAPFIRNLSSYYAETEKIIIRNLLDSPFIHADETTISIRGATQYVWTFTNDKYVIFKLSKTREAQIAQEFLATYRGVLIADFYAGYDSIECKQQRCWVHLIRDLNNDLWESPLDSEYEMFVSEVRGLIVPIMEAVQKYGLKRCHLNRFTKQVDTFYARIITDKSYKSELALRYQKRFVRYRESLFTFIEQDGIPWHNNTAERALRHIAKQRAISGSFHEAVTRDYLRLLDIRQTCRFQNKSFLKFLFSKEKDIDQFKAQRTRELKTSQA